MTFHGNGIHLSLVEDVDAILIPKEHLKETQIECFWSEIVDAVCDTPSWQKQMCSLHLQNQQL